MTLARSAAAAPEVALGLALLGVGGVIRT